MSQPAAPTNPTQSASRSRAQLWLGLGAAAGLLVAAAAVIGERPDVDDLPDGAVARVGDAMIRVEEYERLVAGLESDRREPIDATLRRHVLERMIDEELLVQRAVELGLVDIDRRVRANLTSAMIQSIVDDAEEYEATQSDLRSFYASEGDFFTSPGRLRVAQIFFRMRATERGTAEERAAAAERRGRVGRRDARDARRDRARVGARRRREERRPGGVTRPPHSSSCWKREGNQDERNPTSRPHAALSFALAELQ